jgi:hypothetical protein
MTATICHRKGNGYHHHLPDMEFSAFFEKTTNLRGDVLLYLKYFLFIKYKENIYIEIKNVGYILMPFQEMLKNKLLNMYYDLSLLLVKDKNRFVENVSDEGNRIWDAEITDIYKGRRNCFVDTAYILNGEVKTDKQYCYYDINAYELIDMKVDTASEIEFFNYNFKVRIGYEISNFEKRRNNYMNIVVGYVSTLMEKELDEISAIEEDKRNLIKLVKFYDSKKYMNCDLFEVIYNNLISTPDTFAPYLANLEANLEDSESSIRNVIRQL